MPEILKFTQIVRCVRCYRDDGRYKFKINRKPSSGCEILFLRFMSLRRVNLGFARPMSENARLLTEAL